MNRASVMHVTKIGTLLAVFVAYTAAIAVSSVGSDCDINDYTYDDNSNSSIKSICPKINASATFMWFATFSFALIAYVEKAADDKEGGEPYSGLGASDAGGPGPGEWDGGAAEEGQKEVPPVAASADL